MKIFRVESNQLYSSKTKVVQDLEKITSDLPKINSAMQFIKDKVSQLEANDADNKTYISKLTLNLK
jgi:hypothetical protein